MSQSPLEPAPVVDALEPYRASWADLNRLLRGGYSWSGRERNCAFLNTGRGGFANVSAAVGFAFSDDARALALADWDGDGDQDLFLTNRTSPRLRFLQNEQALTHASVTLELRGVRSNRDAVGARVELVLAGEPRRRILRAVRAGEGYLSQSSGRLTIGLGASASIASVRVTWPGNHEELFSGVVPGRAWLLVEGQGRAAPLGVPAQGAPAKKPLPATPVSAPSDHRVPLVRPVPVPHLDLRADDGSELRLFGIQAGGTGTGTGRPILLELFSTTCAPCARELSALAGQAAALQAAGLAPLALSVEPDAERERVAAFLRERGWPFPWATATQQALEVLEALQGVLLDRETPLTLPASFLIDANGALRVLYTGPVEPATVLADRKLCDLGDGALFDAVSPFPGRWMFPGLPSDADFFEGRLRGRGLEDVAREFARGRLTVVRSSPADLLQEFGRRSAVEGRLEEAEVSFRRALSVDPRHEGALFDLAIVLHRQERLAEAAELYAKLLVLRPDQADARFNLALVRVAQGQREAALRELRWLEAHRAENTQELRALVEALPAER